MKHLETIASQLDEWDARVGDGDCGRTVAKGARVGYNWSQCVYTHTYIYIYIFFFEHRKAVSCPSASALMNGVCLSPMDSGNWS